MGSFADDARQALAEFVGSAADIVRLSRDLRGRVANLLIVDQLQAAGLEIEPGVQLTPRVIADAVRAKVLNDYGLDCGDLLDQDSVKKSMRREALRVVGDQLGVQGTQREIAQALKAAVVQQLRDAAASGDAEFLAAMAVGENKIAEALRASKAEDSQSIKNFSEAAEKNRERQARYRANHKRVWIAR